MPGLDKKILDVIDPTKVIARIKIDIRTDFILAPHYNAIFINAGDELWARVQELLKAGHYQPELPRTIGVPKERGFTRPGSILGPADRFVYQALIDIACPALEAQLDRDRTFSHILATDGNSMFEPAHESWNRFQAKIGSLCSSDSYIVKADIANYFERLPQHHLVNLIARQLLPIRVRCLLRPSRDTFGSLRGRHVSAFCF